MNSYLLLFTLAVSVICVKNSEFGLAFSKRNGKVNHLSRRSELLSKEELSLLNQRKIGSWERCRADCNDEPCRNRCGR